MNRGIRTALTILLVGVSYCASAQSYPGFSQYLTNGMVINPAYTGSRGTMSSLFAMKKQWAKVEGAPTVQAASIHAPLKNDKVALGVMYSRNTYGITIDQSVYVTYAYHLHFNKSKLSFGIQGGADLSNTNYEGINTGTPNDPAFTGAPETKAFPNVGAGIYYYSSSVFLGASVPTFLNYTSESSTPEANSYQSVQNYKMLFLAGGLISFSQNFRFKPSVLLKYSMDQEPLALDINGNFIIADIFWLGASYRTVEESFVGILELQLTQQLKIGYSYDYQMGDIGNFSSGSHEVLLRVEFGRKVSASSPKFF